MFKETGEVGMREQLAESFSDDLLFADGYDSAIIGVAGGFDSGRGAVALVLSWACANCTKQHYSCNWPEYLVWIGLASGRDCRWSSHQWPDGG